MGFFDRIRDDKEKRDVTAILRLLGDVRKEQLQQGLHIDFLIKELEEIKKKIPEIP